MKFYPTHQKDLTKSIAHSGFTQTDFSFSKKKGRIIITQNSSKNTFSFIEKKEGNLDIQTMQILDDIHFEISINKSTIEILPSWEVVLMRFNNWLKKL